MRADTTFENPRTENLQIQQHVKAIRQYARHNQYGNVPGSRSLHFRVETRKGRTGNQVVYLSYRLTPIGSESVPEPEPVIATGAFTSFTHAAATGTSSGPWPLPGVFPTRFLLPLGRPRGRFPHVP